MRNLKRPDISVPVEQIFEECVSGYKGRSKAQKAANVKKRERLLTCKEAVKRDSEKYAEGIRQGNFEKTSLPDKKLEQELADVYSDNFVNEDKPGRKFYVLLGGGKELKRCPICGSQGGDVHMDHFLPKSVFPTLCVTPDNLIPICQRCNKLKGTHFGFAEDSQLFHLYFDRIPTIEREDEPPVQEVFLCARIEPDYRVTYSIECPDDWDEVLRHRIENLVQVCKLLERFGDRVDTLMSLVCNEWKIKVKRNLPPHPSQAERDRVETEVLQDILDGKLLGWCDSPNEWESALLRAMYDQIDTALIWCRHHRADEETSKKYALTG